MGAEGLVLEYAQGMFGKYFDLRLSVWVRRLIETCTRNGISADSIWYSIHCKLKVSILYTLILEYEYITIYLRGTSIKLL